MPASRTTGTDASLDDDLDVVGVTDAHARSRSASPAASPRRSPASSRRRASDRVVVGVRQDGEALVDQDAGPPSYELDRVGSRVRSSPMTSSLTQSVSNASRASWAVRTASRAV